MNFGSYRYFTSKSWSKVSFNKNSFKMMSSCTNRSFNFATLFSNKLHLVGRIQTLNNIVKRGIAGTSGSITGNGVNIYNNPDISADLLSSNSLMSESKVGCGFNMTSNIFKIAVISDYLLICDGKIIFKIFINFSIRAALHVGQSIKHSASESGLNSSIAN